MAVLMAIELIHGKDVERLKDEELRSVLNALLDADASQHRVPLVDLSITTRNDDPDAGIDAWIKWPAGAAHDVLRPGENVLQYKSGKLTKELLRSEFRKSGVQRVLKKGGSYLLCAGHDYVHVTKKRYEDQLKGLCRRKGIPISHAKIIFGSALARWICRYPAVAARAELGKNIPQFITVERWQKIPRYSNSFRADDPRSETIGHIRLFLQSEALGTTLRLEGRPGVGKTRLALEAVRTRGYSSRVLYFEDAENPDILRFFTAVSNDQESYVIAVLDECAWVRQTSLEQYAQLSRGRLKLICVGVSDPLYEGPPLALSQQYELKPLPDSDIQAIISESFPGAPKDHIDLVVRLSGGYVKLAMFIAATLDQYGPKQPVELAKVTDVGKFLRGFVEKDVRRSLQVLSVLAQVGWYDELRPEASTVAKFVGLSTPKLEQSVKKLRDQGIAIQKGRYLYVSPELLAIKSAADLWSEKDYRLLDLIEKIEGREPRRQLLSRLATMGEYPEMRDAVGGVMSKEGLFPTLKQLDQEFLSEVFRILSSAVPTAAVNLLTELIGPATKDDLQNFETGRRNVMWAIESLLRWPETSMKAARALMKLALSETENLSNNATSVFKTFFQVFLSGSPIPLMERFALIEELLDSDDSPSRLLAAQAVAGSLQSHEIRSGGDTDYLSKRPYPPEWKPKTYGEIWEARRKALGYLKQIGAGSDEAAVVARRELLQSPYALVSQGQVDDAIGVLESAVAMSDDERRSIIRSCDQINRVPNLTDEQRAKVKWIRDSAFGNTYFDRIRRWVGGRLPEDFDPNSASGFDAADRRVMELAEEGLKSEIGSAEMEWLSSREAENVWPFGRRLGELDKDEKFRERIFQAAPDDENCMLLAAYVWGRGAASGAENRERLLDDLMQAKPMAAFGATWRGDATVAGAERIIQLVATGRVPASSLRMLRYGGWVIQLPVDYAIEIVNVMLRFDAESNAESVLGVIDYAVRSKAISVQQLGDAIWRALEVRGPQRSPSFDWHWGRVADLVAASDPGRLARVFLTFFESDDTWLSTDSAQSALQHATRSDAHSVWEVVGAALLRDDLTAVRLRLKLGQWFGELIPPETLAEWAQRHGRRGVLTAAELLDAKGGHLSDSARLLVKIASNPKEVLNQLFANTGTGSFVGLISSHLEGQLATLRNWAQDEDPRIRSWAEAAIVYAEKGVKRQKLLEEEGKF
jgi:hypothetical protein